MVHCYIQNCVWFTFLEMLMILKEGATRFEKNLNQLIGKHVTSSGNILTKWLFKEGTTEFEKKPKSADW